MEKGVGERETLGERACAKSSQSPPPAAPPTPGLCRSHILTRVLREHRKLKAACYHRGTVRAAHRVLGEARLKVHLMGTPNPSSTSTQSRELLEEEMVTPGGGEQESRSGRSTLNACPSK